MLRAHGTHACPLATTRAHTHGASQGRAKPQSEGANAAAPTMVTLILPVGRTAAAPSRGCPHLRRLAEQAGEEAPSHASTTDSPTPCGFGHLRLAELGDSATSDCEPHDPWAGATAYVRVRRLSFWWSHPFTVAGSVALDAKDAAATGCPPAC